MNVFFGFFCLTFFPHKHRKKKHFKFFSTRRSRTGDLLLRNLVTVNFETHPSLTSCFSLNINSILTRLEVNDETKRQSKIFIFFLQQKHFYKKLLILHFFFVFEKNHFSSHLSVRCTVAKQFRSRSRLPDDPTFFVLDNFSCQNYFLFITLFFSFWQKKKFVLDGSFPVADGQVFGNVSVLVVDALHAALVELVLTQGHHHDVAGRGGLAAVDTGRSKQ